jgi:DNA-binding transcriptional MocR family regulator
MRASCFIKPFYVANPAAVPKRPPLQKLYCNTCFDWSDWRDCLYSQFAVILAIASQLVALAGSKDEVPLMDWLDTLEPIVHHKDKRSPLYMRLTERVRNSIISGELAPNEKLPADRELAKVLNVDRSTIARAYDQLEAEGLVYSHVGRGTFVSQVAAPTVAASKQSIRYDELPVKGTAQFGPSRLVWTDKFSRSSDYVSNLVNRQRQSTPPAECISFSAGSPSDEFFPQTEFREIVESLLDSASAHEMLGYSQPEGHPALLREVQSYLSRQGIKADLSEILILSGSQQGIDLVARTLLDPDDVVLIEDPSYFWALCNFSATGARTVPVSMDDEGLRLDSFENVASRVDAKLLYTIPTFQNPTGATLPESRRRKLLDLAARFQVPILEDNFVGDLSYTDTPIAPLKSMDEHGCVIYQGTFSKALCPGLRLGWLVAPRAVMSRLQLAKRTCDLSTNSMAQIILAEYLRRGYYEQHLREVRAEYASRLDTMCGAIDKHASSYLSYTRPAGGMFLWCKLPPGYSSRELLSFAEREGVTYSPGDVYYVAGGHPETLRLTFIQQTSAQIEEGIQRLSKALKQYGSSRKRVQGEGFRVAESTFI